MSLRQERVAKGLCPNCGKEAAPYYLCWNCRAKARFRRTLDRGAKVGALSKERRADGVYFSLPKVRPEKTAKWGSTPVTGLPDSDGRSQPKLRGVRVDVEATLIEVIRVIDRPCTIEEIMAAWGKLRDRRNSPLPVDLAAIIAAQDKRERKRQKHLAQMRQS